MKKLNFFLLSSLAACSPVTEKIDLNVIFHAFNIQVEQIMQVMVKLDKSDKKINHEVAPYVAKYDKKNYGITIK